MTRWGLFLLVLFFVLGLGKTNTNKAIAITVCVTALVLTFDDGHATSDERRRRHRRDDHEANRVAADLGRRRAPRRRRGPARPRLRGARDGRG